VAEEDSWATKIQFPLSPSPPARKRPRHAASGSASKATPRRTLPPRHAGLRFEAGQHLASQPQRAPLPSQVPSRRPRIQAALVPPRLQAVWGTASASTSGRIQAGRRLHVVGQGEATRTTPLIFVVQWVKDLRILPQSP
jgi:hypothetical protein